MQPRVIAGPIEAFDTVALPPNAPLPDRRFIGLPKGLLTALGIGDDLARLLPTLGECNALGLPFAPFATYQLLQDRLTHPARTARETLHLRREAEAVLATLDGDTMAVAETWAAKVARTIEVFDRAREELRDALRLIDKLRTAGPAPLPFSPSTPALVALIACVRSLILIRDRIPAGPFFDKWKRDIDAHLLRAEIKKVSACTAALDAVGETPNLLVFASGDAAFDSACKPGGEFAAMMEAGERYTRLSKGFAPGDAKAFRQSRRGVLDVALAQMHQLEAELAAFFESRESRLKTFPVLAGFAAAVMHNTLRHLDLACRTALQVRGGSHSFASIDPSGAIELRNLLPCSLPYGASPLPLEALTLGPADRGAFITGETEVGKSLTLRMIQLSAIANQAGLPLPATSATLPIFRRFLHVAASQDETVQGEGNFGTNLHALTTVLRIAGPRDLVLVDNVPSGSDPVDMFGIASALFGSLFATGARSLVVTSLSDVVREVGEHHGIASFVLSRTDQEVKLAPGIATDKPLLNHLMDNNFPAPFVRLYGQELGRLDRFPPGAASVYEYEARTNFYETDFVRRMEREMDFMGRRLYGTAMAEYPASLFRLPETGPRLWQFLSGYHPDDNRLADKVARGLGYDVVPRGDVETATSTEATRRLAVTRELVALGEETLRLLQEKLNPLVNISTDDDIVRLQDRLFEACAEFDRAAPSNGKEVWLSRSGYHVWNTSDRAARVVREASQDPAERQEEADGPQVSLVDRLRRSLLAEIDEAIGTALAALRRGLHEPTIVTADPRRTYLNLENVSVPLVEPKDVAAHSVGESDFNFFGRTSPLSFQLGLNNPRAVIVGANSSGKSTFCWTARVEIVRALNGFYTSGPVTVSEVHETFYVSSGSRPTMNGERVTSFADVLARFGDMFYLAGRNETARALFIFDELQGAAPVELLALQNVLLSRCGRPGSAIVMNTNVPASLLHDDITVHGKPAVWRASRSPDGAGGYEYSLVQGQGDPSSSRGLELAAKYLTADEMAVARALVHQRKTAGVSPPLPRP